MELSPSPSFKVLKNITASASPALPTEDLNLPPELHSYCERLESWAKANLKDARNDTVRFWTLKGPAIVSAVSSGILALKHWNLTSAILAAIASACVIIDGVSPPGQMRNSHLLAVHELRELQASVITDWQIGKLSGKPPNLLAAEVLKSAKKSRKAISRDLIKAETSFGKSSRTK